MPQPQWLRWRNANVEMAGRHTTTAGIRFFPDLEPFMKYLCLISAARVMEQLPPRRGRAALGGLSAVQFAAPERQPFRGRQPAVAARHREDGAGSQRQGDGDRRSLGGNQGAAGRLLHLRREGRKGKQRGGRRGRQGDTADSRRTLSTWTIYPTFPLRFAFATFASLR